MTDPLTVPNWCRWQRGRGPVLLVAPHGGRRPRPDRLADGSAPKVNDLYTTELAWALAARLEASLIVNTARDRNELDLNRWSQVRDHAPWFLQLLERELAVILEQHPVAEVLFVHGWNVTQARCDVGIGAALADEAETAAHAAALTVGPAYVHQHLAAFRRRCAAADILITYGERYPARHPNNLLQLFRRQPRPARGPVAAQLSRWAAAERVHAVQLELGVPLRWPGATREHFLDAATEAFSPAAESVPVATITAPITAERVPAPHVLQFHDARAGVGLIAGVGPRGQTTTGARVLLFLGDRAVALFTGEAHRRHAVHGAPVFTPQAEGCTVRFAGSLLRVHDGRLYRDLETALAASALCPASVDVCFVPGAVPSYGRVTGLVRCGAETFTIDTHGFADPRLARRVGTHPRQAMLSAAFGVDGAVLARFGDTGDTGTFIRFDGAAATTSSVAGMTVHFDGDPIGPERLVLNPTDGPPLVARVVSRMAIVQPAPSGSYARISFGIARFALGTTRVGSGFYEYTRIGGPQRSAARRAARE